MHGNDTAATARTQSARGNSGSVNPLWCVSTFSLNRKWALKDTHKPCTQTTKHFVSFKPLPCVETVCVLLRSRNTVWVLTQILKYLRAASLSCFAVKWLPLQQWDNNWYDNRFIWASSSLWCYFVEWRVKAMAACTQFGFVCVCACLLRDKVRQKYDSYHMTVN